MPMLNTFVQHNISNPSQGIRLEKETKCFQFGKEIKLHLFTEDMTLCVEKVFKIPQKTCTESFRVQNQHSNIFPCMNNNRSKKKNKKTILIMFYFLSYSQELSLNKKYIYICTRSLLWHVGSSSLTRD